ncbi:hypothetical protein BGZ75_002946 [Mortierella antarctica]|nr:hypothetical protein BGZ75_002946 [Mortierella antarctica]
MVRKRRRARAWSLSRSEPSSFPIPSQPQQPAVPLYQPPETASSLSSFTRVSAAGPEMSSVLAGAGARSGGQASSSRSPSSSAVVGFSLARLFVRQPRARGADESGKSVYMHHKDPLQDWRSQKTPSPVLTRSSSHDYCWGDLHSKEYTKDGFPIITLTSPTNSESSIPIPVVTTEPIGASTSTAGTSSICMPMSEQPPSGFLHHQVVSNSALLKDMDETVAPVFEDKGSPTSSIDAADRPNLYILRPSVPPHMLLHPSSTYNKLPRFEKQALAPPSTSPSSLTDFPPTYEEAVDDSGVSSKTTKDDQGSSNSSNSSNSNSGNSDNSDNSGNSSNSGNSGNSNTSSSISSSSSSSNTNISSNNHNSSGTSEIVSISGSGPPAVSLFPAMGSYSSPRVLSAESMDWASYRHRTEWNAEYGAEGEVDPLGSPSLSNNH